jgi:hypothetical protein
MPHNLKTSRLAAGSLLRKTFFGALLAAALSGSSAFAATIEKAGTGTSGLGTSGANVNWTGGTAPGTGDVALWDSVSTTGSQTLDAVTSWQGIQLTSATADILLGAGTGGTLVLGTSGIDTSAATVNLNIGAPLALVGSQTWNLNSSETTTVSAALTIGVAGNATASIVTMDTGTVSLTSTGTILPNTTTTNTTPYELILNGATFSDTGTFTVNGQRQENTNSGINMESGTATFNGLTLTESAGTNSNFANVTVTGGTLNASTITVTREGGSTKTFVGGLVVTGGIVNVAGSYYLGTVSYEGSTVQGGVQNVDTGATAGNGVYIDSGSGTSGGRGAQQNVTSGSLIVNSASTVGITLAGGVTATSSGALSVSGTGNVSTPILNFGNSTTTAGTANLTMTGGSLYVGSGGVVTAGTLTGTVFSVTNALIGANSDFTLKVPATLSGATFQAADFSGTAHNIAIAAALTSTTGLTKTGGGELSFNTTQTFTGTTAVNAGTLLVNSSFASTVNVGTGGTLGGNGTISAPVTVSGSFFPGNITDPVGGVLTVSNSAFTWNGNGGTAQFLLSNSSSTSDELAITGTGALDQGTGSVFEFNFDGTGNDLGGPTVYTLITFASTTFTSGPQFTYINLPAGLTGTFVLNPTNLQLDVAAAVPEPAMYGVVLGGMALVMSLRRRRSK